MADNAQANPGAGGVNFRLLEDTEATPAFWSGIVPGFTTGGASGTWNIQQVSVTFGQGLPTQPEGGLVVQSLTNANANATHGVGTTARGGRKDFTAQVIIGGGIAPTSAIIALELDLSGAGNWIEVARADFGTQAGALNAVAPGKFLSSNGIIAQSARTTLVTIAGGTTPIVNSWVGSNA